MRALLVIFFSLSTLAAFAEPKDVLYTQKSECLLGEVSPEEKDEIIDELIVNIEDLDPPIYGQMTFNYKVSKEACSDFAFETSEINSNEKGTRIVVKLEF